MALKLLPPGIGLSDQAVKRFEREAQAPARLHPTNIVPVHAIGQEDGTIKPKRKGRRITFIGFVALFRLRGVLQVRGV